MSCLAQNQLNFQEYNSSMKGPESPISMDVLKSNANSESLKQAALGKVFDAEQNEYIDTPQKNIFNMPVSTPPVKESRKRKKSATDNMVYEVYTTSQIADGFSGKTRVVYMGQEFFDTASDARDVADKLRAKNMECEVYSVKRRPLKHRKRIKKSGGRRSRKKKEPLKCVNDFNVEFGNWQPLPGSLKAKGKQSTWWINSNVNLKEEQTAETIRDVALAMKKVQASVLVEKFEEQIRNSTSVLMDLTQHSDKEGREEVLKAADTVILNGILSGMGYHCDTENKSKLRQITLRLRNMNKRIVRENMPVPSADELLKSMRMNA